MRSIISRASTLPLVVCLAVLPQFARSDNEAPTIGKAEVKISLAVLEGYNITRSRLHVIIENITDQPQRHFEEWNSWGYGNVTLEWTDASGARGTVSKVPGSWDKNGPSTVTLQPSQALVREISFDDKLWQGWPPLKYGTILSVKVVYHAAGEPQSDGWAGKATSPDQAITIR